MVCILTSQENIGIGSILTSQDNIDLICIQTSKDYIGMMISWYSNIGMMCVTLEALGPDNIDMEWVLPAFTEQ